MKNCMWTPPQDEAYEGEEKSEECGAPGFFEFLPSPLVLCEEHCRYTYDRYELLNRQLYWYLELREKFRGQLPDQS